MLNNKDAVFSEYQLYADYVVHGRRIDVHHVRVFRRMDCVKDTAAKGLLKYDVIAYEPHHVTDIVRKYRIVLLYKLGLTLG